MSTNFLTVAQAKDKLGASITGNAPEFVTKTQLIASGKADESRLTRYSDNQFVIDDDIQIGIKTIQEAWIDTGYAEWGDSSKSSVRFHYDTIQNIPNRIIPPVSDGNRLTSGNEMFYDCSDNLVLPHFDTSNMTSMEFMFSMTHDIDLSRITFDMSNCISINSMFDNCLATVCNVTNCNKIIWADWPFQEAYYLHTINGVMDFIHSDCEGLFEHLNGPIMSLANIQWKNVVGNYHNDGIINMRGCPNMTRDSLIYMFTYLRPPQTSSGKIVLHLNAYNRLSAADRAIANSKGYSVTAAR